MKKKLDITTVKWFYFTKVHVYTRLLSASLVSKDWTAVAATLNNRLSRFVSPRRWWSSTASHARRPCVWSARRASTGSMWPSPCGTWWSSTRPCWRRSWTPSAAGEDRPFDDVWTSEAFKPFGPVLTSAAKYLQYPAGFHRWDKYRSTRTFWIRRIMYFFL